MLCILKVVVNPNWKEKKIWYCELKKISSIQGDPNSIQSIKFL
jgi:hypothetical protein